MVYNPPATGHVVIILDNGTTAMTGHQEHPGTGRTLEHEPTGKVVFEDLARAVGVQRVHVIEPRPGSPELENLLTESLAADALTLIIARRPCILVAKQIREYEKCASACEGHEQ
jgi:indolepyruvate ferredoxin oxidoreductase alpha subunit